MIKDDYILREIERLVQALAKIFKLHKQGENDEALAAIDDAFLDLVGLDRELVEMISLKDLLALMKLGIDLDITRCLVIADLLKARGDVRTRMGAGQESAATYARSLTLFLNIFTSPVSIDLPEYRARAEELIGKLKGCDLLPETKVPLFRYFEKTGRYARAEDVLFEMVEGDADETTYNEGFGFYERLLRRSDEELAAGDLPREEVQNGLASLRKRFGVRA